MSADPEILLSQQALQADVAALRERFPETRALYREVCGLLFFRYGVTPTANKLYGLVRKGSMGTPAEVLQQFWQELRDKSRVRIEHPGLPEPLKQLAAESIFGIWEAATAAAAGQLATQQEAARQQVEAAKARLQQAEAFGEAAREEAAAVRAELAQTRRALAEAQEAAAREREAHAATEARLQEARAQVQAGERQLAEGRERFSADLESVRQQLVVAEERMAASERRALREVDQERTLRQKAERQLEVQRGELLAAQASMREIQARHEDATARHVAETQQLNDRCRAAEQERSRLDGELAAARQALDAIVRRVEKAEAEAAVTRRLVQQFRRAPARRPARGGPRRGEGPGGKSGAA